MVSKDVENTKDIKNLAESKTSITIDHHSNFSKSLYSLHEKIDELYRKNHELSAKKTESEIFNLGFNSYMRIHEAFVAPQRFRDTNNYQPIRQLDQSYFTRNGCYKSQVYWNSEQYDNIFFLSKEANM
ncbi:hypothetical protein EDEG_03424 [Edhazardia aedis USNM 41457]|uniref:Uncharacterized protein n=1 Tax=Edhazardia aedis (strain USNM 41457) TaxID=1003232 RepID=J8ZR21_EDHAE|nr:hypothetical protein EDEG_03424 [Edhazardia aedis USNM 41457]|eukprot:EJW02128.1 hypothetical protein EDEG_03424 [Edhazardia aedis USNM 41457]